jgi:hypothetical protein
MTMLFFLLIFFFQSYTWSSPSDEHEYYFTVCSKAPKATEVNEGLIQINRNTSKHFVLGRLDDVDLEGILEGNCKFQIFLNCFQFYPYTQYHNLYTNRKTRPKETFTKIVVLEIFLSDYLVKKFKKLMHPFKMPFCKVGFSVSKFKKRPYMPNSKLKILFRNYLSTK